MSSQKNFYAEIPKNVEMGRVKSLWIISISENYTLRVTTQRVRQMGLLSEPGGKHGITVRGERVRGIWFEKEADSFWVREKGILTWLGSRATCYRCRIKCGRRGYLVGRGGDKLKKVNCEKYFTRSRSHGPKPTHMTDIIWGNDFNKGECKLRRYF